MIVRRVKCSRACKALLYVHKQTLNQKLQVDLWELHWSILLRFGDYPFDEQGRNIIDVLLHVDDSLAVKPQTDSPVEGGGAEELIDLLWLRV